MFKEPILDTGFASLISTEEPIHKPEALRTDKACTKQIKACTGIYQTMKNEFTC